MSRMPVITVLIALATTVFTDAAKPSIGCEKINGISQLPLTNLDVCDKRDACDIISPGALCSSTASDRSHKKIVDADSYPIMTCSSHNCSAQSPPTGKPGVLQCKLIHSKINNCTCPAGTKDVYECGICSSPISSTCFCCFG